MCRLVLFLLLFVALVIRPVCAQTVYQANAYYNSSGVYGGCDTVVVAVRYHCSGTMTVNYQPYLNPQTGNSATGPYTIYDGYVRGITSFTPSQGLSYTTPKDFLVGATSTGTASSAATGTVSFSAQAPTIEYVPMILADLSSPPIKTGTCFQDIYITSANTQQVYLDGQVVFTGSDANKHTVVVKNNGNICYNYTLQKTAAYPLGVPWYTYAYLGDVISIYADGQIVRAFKVTSGATGAVDYVGGNIVMSGTGELAGSTGTSNTSLSNFNGTSGTNNTLTRGDLYDGNYAAIYNAVKDLKIDSAYSTLASAVDTSSGTAVMRTAGGSGSTSGTTVVSGSFLTKDQLTAMTSTSSVPDATVANLDTADSAAITGTLSAALSATNSISSLDSAQTQLFSSGSDAQLSFETKINSFTNQASAIPASLGTVDSFDLGEVEICPGYRTTISIDLTKPYVGVARGALKAVVALLFFATVLMTVRRFL